MSFIGGIDPCFGRWDDERHLLTDEDGVLFPGKDYYQPARGLFKPAKEISDEFLDGTQYASACADDDDDEVEEGDAGSVDVDQFEDGDQYSDASSVLSESSWAAEDGDTSRLPKAGNGRPNKELTAEEVCVFFFSAILS